MRNPLESALPHAKPQRLDQGTFDSAFTEEKAAAHVRAVHSDLKSGNDDGRQAFAGGTRHHQTGSPDWSPSGQHFGHFLVYWFRPAITAYNAFGDRKGM